MNVQSWDSTIQKSTEWLKDVKSRLGWEDDQRVYLATKATLTALRDRLPPQEAAHFGAQLPMLLRGAYYDGYNPAWKPMKIRKPEEFYELVQRNAASADIPAEQATKAVLGMVIDRTTPGEMEDILSTFPKSLTAIWLASV